MVTTGIHRKKGKKHDFDLKNTSVLIHLILLRVDVSILEITDLSTLAKDLFNCEIDVRLSKPQTKQKGECPSGASYDIEIGRCQDCEQIVYDTNNMTEEIKMKMQNYDVRAVPTTIIDGEIKVVGIPDFPWICGDDLPSKSFVAFFRAEQFFSGVIFHCLNFSTNCEKCPCVSFYPQQGHIA